MKKQELLSIWPLIKNGKFGKMNSTGKIKYVKILCAVQPIVKDFETLRETAVNKMKEGYKDFDDKIQRAQKYEAQKRDGLTDNLEMSSVEYADILSDIANYNKSVDAVLKEELTKEVNTTFIKLTLEEFSDFIDSNDFTGEEAMLLMKVLYS